MFTLKKIYHFVVVFFIYVNVHAIHSLDAIEIGGIYRMSLTTGDTLEGIVEAKIDSSIIIESNGTPYKFIKYLIKSFTLISLPKKKETRKIGDPLKSETLSYAELLHRSNEIKKIKIQITNGSVFEGKISEINAKNVKLDIEGSVISIAKTIISTISTIVPKLKKPNLIPNVQKSSDTYDTLFITNEKKDEYGRNLPPIIVVGKIQSDGADGISLLLLNGKIQNISREKIVRVIKHSKPSYEQSIKVYAKPLFCPPNMILVDLPPGKEGRPFFKVCIDKYEYPNQKGVVPISNISYKDASEECKKNGKRLCSAEEWQWACGGLGQYPYPYGYHLEEQKCNRDGNKTIEPSGTRLKCFGKFGVFDMVGNIFEWVSGLNGEVLVMGGPLSKCQTKSPGMSGLAKPQVGFRCCKSN